MLLTKRLAHFFPTSVRQRGEEYAAPPQVDVHQITNKSVDAAAHGNDDYTLRLEWNSGNKLYATCSCPYFSGNGLCKHIWGLLRHLETIHKNRIPKRFLSIASGHIPVEKPTAAHARSEASGNGAPDSLWPMLEAIDPAGDADGEWEHLDDDRALRTIGRPEIAAPVSNGNPTQSQPATPHLREWELRRVLAPLVQSHPSARVEPLHYCLTHRTVQGENELCVALFRPQLQSDGTSRFLEVRVNDIFSETTAVNRDDYEIVDAMDDDDQHDWRPHVAHRYLILPAESEFYRVQQLAATGRLYLTPNVRAAPDHHQARRVRHVEWDPLHIRHHIEEAANGDFIVSPHLFYGNGQPVTDRPTIGSISGLLVFHDWIGRLTENKSLTQHIVARDTIRIPAQNASELSHFLYEESVPVIGEVPPRLRVTELRTAPRGLIHFTSHNKYWNASMVALYDDVPVFFQRLGEQFFADDGRLIHRDKNAENKLLNEAWELEAQDLAEVQVPISALRCNKVNFVTVLRHFLERNWVVDVNKQRIGSTGTFEVRVATGIDWFDVDGQMTFGDTVLPIPEILKRVEDGNLVRLDNNRFGLLPEKWIEQFGVLLQMGDLSGDVIRYRQAQGFLLDALLAERQDVTFDQKFVEFQDRVRQFQGIRPVETPTSFCGTLRGYQREGHSWLHFLRDFGLGGCLADDMGLGKTVQVLALLESRRIERQQGNAPHQPTLLVVPKSLVFNWLAEAERFTPELRCLDYTECHRRTLRVLIPEVDVVITTYATMRIDIGFLKDIEFDYAILDEAQAIKNPSALTSKAARLIRARHRLALSGTPIENRLTDLWSIFEFLNPGMLGICSIFQNLGRGEVSGDTLQRINRGIKPMVLRRTKDQVLSDLPAKNEQTIICELEPKQRKIYDEVLAFYRQSLNTKIQSIGLSKSKLHVLEALTRLRQIACHPALIDPIHNRTKSSKLEALYENLESVIEEGHKALIFSQFTSLLAIVRRELDKRGMAYEYLDGQTKHRQQCVQRFNNDPAVPLFLLSLKAGGHGLNLTAADYVFILDPWWNPAVEAQAIDRAHRIGQTKPVFAYRLIAKNTVEEKIVALQQSKRELADAIVSADTSLIQNLSMEDLQLLMT